MQMPGFTHIDPNGAAVMADVGQKAETARKAVAIGRIKMNAECFGAVRQGSIHKGDVLGVARVAGIMAAKRTSSTIPLCHSLPLEKAAIDFALDADERSVTATCTVQATGKTGVEMEALTGASVALLTVYDMCKAIDRSMEITGICLLEKSGGKSGDYIRGEAMGRG
jgi:cyclic pyranopterin phosphate synthase